ncbi:hypothetical protein [Intrasporangium sp. YIM S08009]|uniref:hypothetical protein n=1 Tax=Intrasporangium zincisolvens TaxID=3080018 RepID=UPI002B05AB0A|nr:hypothetical protein [Intrasporangium sp. YIM S08009]
MKLYADTPVRRTRQLLSDVLVLLWVGVWVWLGRQTHDVVMGLKAPADSITSAGSSVHSSLTGAGDQAGQIPLVGDQLKQWLGQAASSGTTLSQAGTTMATTVERVSLVLGLVVALVPIAIVVALWLYVRVGFVRRASAAQRFIDASADLDLFALRAMATQPMGALARISDDPAGAWRRQDTAVIRELATLELRDQGLRPPRV